MYQRFYARCPYTDTIISNELESDANFPDIAVVQGIWMTMARRGWTPRPSA